MNLAVGAAMAACLVAASSCGVPAATSLRVVTPAYVWPGDPLLTTLLDPNVPPPAVVILNIAHGDGDVSLLDATADALRARKTSLGAPVKVLGYVWTTVQGQWASRSSADIKAAVDRWLTPRNGRIHYDGIFFDFSALVCGPVGGSNEYRDKFTALRQHVASRLPGAFVVNNPGVAVGACYLEPGKRTADVFVTFEGNQEAYYTEPGQQVIGKGYWIGGNVSNNGRYVRGDVLDFTDAAGRPYSVTVQPESYWHLVHGAKPGQEQRTADLARSRFAGGITESLASMDNGGNPWGMPADRAMTIAHIRAMDKAAAPPAPAPAG